MCGIFGVFDRNNNIPNLEKVRSSIHLLKHRGPNAEGMSLIDNHMALAHTRLSIIDLNIQSNQPFVYQNLTIVFNGEVYNYLELREELIAFGYHFRTNSDTEVVLAAYLHWKDKCVQRFNGMWAFAIYDANDQSLFCSRDRFGVKPFNYCLHKNQFIFSSEIKSIIRYCPELRIPEYNSIAGFCREAVGAQAKETWFKNIYRLLPAHNIYITKSGFLIEKYWSYPKSKLAIDFVEAEREYIKLFNSSVTFRMRSDVPIGLTLSGGLDSASIAFSVHSQFSGKLNTYTARFTGEKFDEYPIAKKISEQLGYNSIPVDVDYSNYTSTLQNIIYHLESAHGSPAIYPLWQIAERAKKDITVYLEGQGADELLGGYVTTVFVDYLKDMVRKGRISQALAETRRHSRQWPILKSILLNIRSESIPAINSFYNKINRLEDLYSGHLKHYSSFTAKTLDLDGHDSYLNRKLGLLHQTGLVDLLHYGDAISMAHSLENRLPFMDYRLVEFVHQLPPEFKIYNGLGKYLHRKAFSSMLPPSITENPSKLGFVSPLKHVFLDEKFGALAVLNSDKFKSRGLFNVKCVQKFVNCHRSLKRNNERMLFKILSTELWFRNFIDE